MNRENVLNLRSSWQIQIIGWCCFYLFHLLESIHAFLTKRVFFDEERVPVFFMFLGSFALRPFLPLAAATIAILDRFRIESSRGGHGHIHSRSLRSRPHFAEFQSCALARFGYGLGVVFFHALHVVQSVLQH